MYFLTKTTYLHALQCRKRFWLARHKPQLLPPGEQTFDPLRNQTIRQGMEVGRAARAHFPDGVLISTHGRAALRHTQKAIAAGVPALFEAAFEHQGVLIRCDILERNADGAWAIVEVKSSARVHAHYLHDLAIQAHVVEQSGLDLTRLEIMHINTKTCTYPHLDQLFQRTDVTARVQPHREALDTRVQELGKLLEQDEPDIAIGRHCNAPHACPFQQHCWAHVPETSIFTIPRLSQEKQDELVRRGILDLRDLPADYELTTAQRAYVDFVCAGKPRIDRQGIRTRLGELVYPLYFFDFETYSPAIPHLHGMRPYQNYPFQYSCHILHADGTLEHKEYLHEDTADPRPALTQQLIQDLGRAGSVIVYNASFERSVLRALAAALPRHAPHLERIIDRIWDQLALIRRCYDHPRFLNSKSIKRVLPVLVPELSYADLNVQRGDEAQVAWRAMLEEDDPQSRSALAASLRAYCERDTLAMVKIHQVLCDLV